MASPTERIAFTSPRDRPGDIGRFRHNVCKTLSGGDEPAARAHRWRMAANDGLKLPAPVFPTPAPAPPVTLPHPVSRPQMKTAEAPVVKDVFREIVETVVFVIVLVFLLKIFIAEAFVIPTGSMAETLLGYQRFVECPQCHIEFPVNCSQEVDPQDRPRMEVDACTCPNCRYKEVWREQMAGP